MQRRRGKFFSEGVGFDHRTARSGGTGPDERGERGLASLGCEHAAKAGEVVADRSGQEPAAAGGPIEVGGTRREPGHIRFLLRQRAGDDLGACADLADRSSSRFEAGAASGRADVGIPDKVDRAGRPAPVGRGRCGEAVANFSDGVSAAGGDAEIWGLCVAYFDQ